MNTLVARCQKNAARCNFQFDMGTTEKEYTVLIYEHARSVVMNGERAGSVSCRFCVLDTGFALV